MTEKFAVRQDPSDTKNWGIIWEYSGTEGGFTSENAARTAAIKQSGSEVDSEESKTWHW